MSISNPDIIDAMTVQDCQLIMLISDHLRWDAYQTAHLKMLQDNAPENFEVLHHAALAVLKRK